MSDISSNDTALFGQPPPPLERALAAISRRLLSQPAQGLWLPPPPVGQEADSVEGRACAERRRRGVRDAGCAHAGLPGRLPCRALGTSGAFAPGHFGHLICDGRDPEKQTPQRTMTLGDLSMRIGRTEVWKEVWGITDSVLSDHFSWLGRVRRCSLESEPLLSDSLALKTRKALEGFSTLPQTIHQTQNPKIPKLDQESRLHPQGTAG